MIYWENERFVKSENDTMKDWECEILQDRQNEGMWEWENERKRKWEEISNQDNTCSTSNLLNDKII